MIRSLCIASLVLLLAGPLAASDSPQVGVTGTVRLAAPDATGVGDPCPQPAFLLESGGITLLLGGDEIDLLPYVDRLVKLTVTQEVLTCGLVPILFHLVHAVEDPAPATLAICGTGGLGCPIRLRSGPGGLAAHMLFVSLSPDFLPLPPERGSFLLGSPFFSIGTGLTTTFSDGLAFDFNIPLDNVLTGLTLHFQAARKEIGLTTGFGGTNPPLQFGNAVSLEIAGHVFVCHPTDC